MKKLTTENFILKSKEIHGEKYDYSLVDYKNSSTKVKIICPIHGVFLKAPIHHYNSGQGCPKCSNIISHSKQKLSKEEFIKKSKEIHGEKYDYSLVDYQNYSTKVKIICPIHGVFEQTPGGHLSGRGCKYCSGKINMNKKSFILKSKEIHGEKYDYSLVDYKNSSTKVKIICPIHGVFEQIPNNHISKKQGCPYCVNRVFDTKSFIFKAKEIHGEKYGYDKSNFSGIFDDIKIICPTHGEILTTPHYHLYGYGCKNCSNNISVEQENIKKLIQNLGFNVLYNERNIIDGLELDLFVPSKKIAIEYNGLYWHSELHKDKNYHLNKTEECEKKGIRLIHIFEDEWVNKKEIVISRIKNILGLTNKKIFARNCEIQIINKKLKKDFLEKNHIQGTANTKIDLGLFYKKELISIMCFGKRPLLNKNEYELIRFCNKLDTTVVGGASKLLNFFIKNFNPKELVSYADKRWSNGNLYEKLGFTLISETPPNYFYLVNKKRESRFKFQKHKLIKENGYDPNKTEWEIMQENGYYRIWDCGNKKYYLQF